MFDYLEFDEKKLKEQKRQLNSLQKHHAEVINTQEAIREKATKKHYLDGYFLLHANV